MILKYYVTVIDILEELAINVNLPDIILMEINRSDL